jgi:hypothetical protein
MPNNDLCIIRCPSFALLQNVECMLENLFIKEGSLFLLFATLKFPKPKSPPTHSMLLVWLESYEWVGVRPFVKFIPMVQGYWTILSKKIQQIF